MVAAKAKGDAVAPAEQPAKPLAEVRQCQDTEQQWYGASAVASGPNRWGIMMPIDLETGAGGGHWATDDDVKDWKVLA